MSRPIRGFALAALLLGLTTSAARADLVVSLSDVTLAPGDTGTMNISVTSNGTDALTTFNLELMIQPISATSVLQFTTSQPDPYANTDYVFAGQSFNAYNSPIPFWNTSSPPDPFVTMTAGDSISSFLDPIPGSVTIPATPGGPGIFFGVVGIPGASGRNPRGCVPGRAG